MDVFRFDTYASQFWFQRKDVQPQTTQCEDDGYDDNEDDEDEKRDEEDTNEEDDIDGEDDDVEKKKREMKMTSDVNLV